MSAPKDVMLAALEEELRLARAEVAAALEAMGDHAHGRVPYAPEHHREALARYSRAVKSRDRLRALQTHPEPMFALIQRVENAMGARIGLPAPLAFCSDCDEPIDTCHCDGDAVLTCGHYDCAGELDLSGICDDCARESRMVL